MFKVPEKFRVRRGGFATSEFSGNMGLFEIILKHKRAPNRKFTVLASNGAGWEHVSVSLPDRCPTWGEMCKIKDLFWGEEDSVIQYHPAKSDYINNHDFCLHLWRPINELLPCPPPELVGLK